MRAIMIDPSTKTVTVIDTTGELEDLYRLIGCVAVDGVSVGLGEILYVDDDGLMADEPGPFFAFAGLDDPLPGRGVILGLDVYGEHTNSHMRLANATDMISWPEVELVGYTALQNSIDAAAAGHRPIYRKKEQH